MPSALTVKGEFVEQRFSVLQVGRVEALSERVVDFREHRARLVAAIGIAEQSSEPSNGLQLE